MFAPVGADDKDGAASAGPVTDPFNSGLAVQVASNGRFNIGAKPDPTTGVATATSWDLMYRWPSSPGTSFTTFRIDGVDYVFGSSGTLTQAPSDSGLTNSSTWTIGDLQITQTLAIVDNPQTGQPDRAEISYSVGNNGGTTIPSKRG